LHCVMSSAPKLHDNLPRGVGKPPEPGSGLMLVVLRLLPLLLDYQIVFHSWFIPKALSYVGVHVTPLDPLRSMIVFAFLCISSLRVAYWAVTLMNTYMDYKTSFSVAAFNFVVGDLLTCIALFASGSKPMFSLPLDYIGIAFFLIGSFFETGYEIQRKAFKDDPTNKGKLFTGGLAALCMHPNYFGYTLWRTGLPLSAGNVYIGLAEFVMFSYDFLHRGIPVLQDYMKKNYKDQYEQYRRHTKIFIPFLY